MAADPAPLLQQRTRASRAGARPWPGPAPRAARDRERPHATLARLAAAAGPVRCALAAIAERLVATRAYERLCFTRLGDYARERPGVSARQLQELARVHRAFARLPALEVALRSNALPWSKVRLLVRVATPESEQAWIARAASLGCRELEQRMRAESAKAAGRTHPEDEDEADPTRRVVVRCTPAVAEKWAAARELAERVAGRRLGSGEALELVLAELLSGVPLAPAWADACDAPRPRAHGGREREARPCPRARAREAPARVRELVSGLDRADAFELDRRLRLAVRLEQTLDAAMAPLLRTVRCADYDWGGEDYQPLGGFAREQLGMSASKARALIRLERAAEICPELRDAYRSGRISWVKAQCLLPLLLLDVEGEHRPIWLAWAQRVTVRRLEQDVERALLLRAGHSRAWFRCKFQPSRAQDPIPEDERQMCAPDVDPEATQELAWRVPTAVAALFVALRETLRGRLGIRHDGELFEAMLDHALHTWTLRDPRARRVDPVIERDGYRCAAPGCTSRHSLHDHHIVFRSHGGSHAAWNRISLCAFHHQRCVHAGRMRVRGRAPDGLIFQMPLGTYRSGDIAVAA